MNTQIKPNDQFSRVGKISPKPQSFTSNNMIIEKQAVRATEKTI